MRTGTRFLTCAATAAVLCAACERVVLRGGTSSSPAREDTSPPAPAREGAAPGTPSIAAKKAASPAPAVPPKPAAPTAKLGVLAPFSGSYAAYGKAYLDGAQIAVESYNQRGPGRAELVPGDSKSEPLAALAATRHLIDSDGVVAILGSILSMPTVVAGLQANCSRVPLLSNVATEDGIGDIGPYVFHEGASRQRAARAAADLASFELRKFRAATLYSETGEGRALANAFGERMIALGGEVVTSEVYANGTTDFTVTAQRLRAAAPDVLYLPIGVDDALLILPALVYQGLGVQVIGTEEWNNERLLRGAGVDLEGTLLPSDAPEASDAVLARFRATYKARFAARDNRFAAAGYLGATHLLDLLAQNPKGDRELLRAALENRLKSAPQNTSQRFLVVHNHEVKPFDTP